MNSVWCVGRNFDEHAKELGNPISRDEPLIFLKPGACVQHSPQEFALPRQSQQLQPEVEIVFRIARAVVAPLAVDLAWSLVDAWAVGLDWTARDLQSRAKSSGHPWVRAKGFRGAATLGEWQKIEAGDKNFNAQRIWSGLELGLEIDGKTTQTGRLSDAVFSIADVLVNLSGWTDLAAGDIVFMGTPPGVRTVGPGAQLKAWAQVQCATGAVRSAISLRTLSA